MKKSVLLLCGMLLASVTLWGQERYASLSGTVIPTYTFAQTQARLESSPDGAVVELRTKSDTLYAVVFKSQFRFDKVAYGQATLNLMHINFEPTQQTIMVNGPTECNIYAQAKLYQIAEITVKGEAPAVTMVGDTVRFNAAALKMMQGEAALGILKQMPGVVVSDNGITINGQRVARTYVNHTELFGQDVMTALINVPAEDVNSIDTYLEKSERNRNLGRADEKVRVINIRTKVPIVQAVSGNVLASGGGTGVGSPNRYHLGAVGNFFSEKFILSANALTSNMGLIQNNSQALNLLARSRGLDTKQNYAAISFSKLWVESPQMMYQKHTRLSGGYSFNNNKSLTRNAFERIYLADKQYTSRQSYEQFEQSQTSTTHHANAMLEMIRPKSRLLVMSNLIFDSGRTHSTQQSTTSLDNVERYTGVDQSGDTFNRNVGLDLTYEGYLGSKLRWGTKAAWTSESAQTERVRLDTVSSTPMRTIASIAPLATGHNVKATVGLQSMPNARHFFSLTYDYSYIYSVDKMTSVDWSGNETHVTDVANT